MFPLSDKISASAFFDERTKAFTVSDARIVCVPGLTKLDAVEIDGVPMPFTDLRNFAKLDPGKEPEVVQQEMPIVELRYADEVGPFLARSVFSNDGVWQIGSSVVVRGDWDEDPETFTSSIDLASKDAEIEKLKAELADAKKEAKAKVSEDKKGAK